MIVPKTNDNIQFSCFFISSCSEQNPYIAVVIRTQPQKIKINQAPFFNATPPNTLPQTTISINQSNKKIKEITYTSEK